MAIHAHRRVREILHGEYSSVFRGRSMDFEDLREYVPGDAIRDIDWKATARSGQTLVRRYVDERKHNILLVMDSGRGMSADSAPGQRKLDVAILAAGMLGYVACKHGDLVALATGDATSTQYLPLKGSLGHVEQLLQTVHRRVRSDAAASDITAQLNFVTRTIRRRMMVIVIADDVPIDDELERVLRRARVQHEVMWVTVADVDPFEVADEMPRDVDSGDLLPDWMLSLGALRSDFTEAAAEHEDATATVMRRLGIARVRIATEAQVLPGLITLLQRQRHEVRGDG